MRDVISAEMWEAINTFHLGLADAATRRDRLRRSVLVRQLRQGAARRCSGVSRRARCCATRRTRSWTPAGASSRRTWCCGCSASRCRRAVASDGDARRCATDRRWRCSPRSAGCRPTGARCRRAPSARGRASFLLFTRSYPDSVAASIDAVRDALAAADANPRASEPVLRLSRVLADLEFRGAARATRRRELLEVCEIVGRELALDRSRHHRRATLAGWRRWRSARRAEVADALLDPLRHRVPLQRARSPTTSTRCACAPRRRRRSAATSSTCASTRRRGSAATSTTSAPR